MTKAAELFLKELESQNLPHLPIIETEGRTVIPLGYKLKNTRVEIKTMFTEGDNSVAIRCFGFLKVNEDQFPQALLCCNRLNKKMRWVKFYIDEELDVNLEDDAIVDDETGGKEVFDLVMRMAAIADEAYPELNRAIWS